MDKKAFKKISVIRKASQILSGILANGNIKGFFTGTIYKGALKNFCLPSINCYSCPAALGACPIGAMQAVFDGRKRRFAFYVVGYLALIGISVGRFVCGWLCLFGLIEELLYKIPTPKITIPQKVDRILRYLKYIMLFLFVFALPFFYRTDMGMGEPFFCKYICPVGTFEAGIPLLLLNKGLASAVGLLFKWKFVLLALCILSCIFIYRPFCKYVCPLGAFYGLFQNISILRLNVNKGACINCNACSKACKMNVTPNIEPNSSECIRCGECIASCPQKALSFGVK